MSVTTHPTWGVPRRVLVTGGAGFVGSHVVDRLLDAGCEVVVLDSLIAHGGERPPWLPADADAELVVGDVRDPDSWLRAARGVDAVCHQAARVGLGVDFGDVRRYVADNDAGTAAGLWALHELGFRGRMVLASSMVVYGEGRYACPTHGDVRPAPRSQVELDAGRFDPPCPTCRRPLAWAPVDEDAAIDPRNVYAATKVHQEHLCTVFGREHGVPVTALRYHNVYGPRMPRDTPYAGVASIFASAVESGDPPRVYEDGAQTRDFVHVVDVARANVAALTAGEPMTGAVNVASGTPRTVLDLARSICGGTGLEPVVVGGGRLGDVRHVVASPAKAERLLGFRAVEPFAPEVAGMDLIVLAKEPVPGRVKTRLCPPCSPAVAAEVAEAALADTLAAACASRADRVVLALDGRPGPWCPSDVVVVDQGDGGLDRRLTRAWEATAGPAVQIGMDTPQLTATDLDQAMEHLLAPGVDAVLGEAADGGWWAVGFRRPEPGAFLGVPTSRPDTGRRQLERLGRLGLRVAPLPLRTDVDTWSDALAVAGAHPGTRFAAVVRRQLAALETSR